MTKSELIMLDQQIDELYYDYDLSEDTYEDIKRFIKKELDEMDDNNDLINYFNQFGDIL